MATSHTNVPNEASFSKRWQNRNVRRVCPCANVTDFCYHSNRLNI